MATPSADDRNFTQDSYNKKGLNVFILSMIVSIGFFILVVVFHHGVDLKEVAEKNPQTAAAPTGIPAEAGTKTDDKQPTPSGNQVPATAPGAPANK